MSETAKCARCTHPKMSHEHRGYHATFCAENNCFCTGFAPLPEEDAAVRTESVGGCPKCGAKQGYVRTLTVSGTETYVGEWQNAATTRQEEIESDDLLRYREHRYLVCIACGGKVANPRYVNPSPRVHAQ